MASYRFSASVISRSTGRSATAAAAYRAAEIIHDERYGETHDYTRKGGVEHSEIMAPENAPEWMRDRSQLWNAVEAAEKRKDAQLSREVQLSLAHELNAEQRRDMVRQFVHEQFVDCGMIADVNLHAPHRSGDERNYHAHIMLTMRELAGEGFGKKARDWNDKANMERWREEWAVVQNREFERLGLDVRVDHRSFEAQGIDREPEQHEGPTSTKRQRDDEQSTIAGENDRRRAANANRADLHAQLLRLNQQIDRERERFAFWADRKAGELESAQSLSKLDHQRAQELKAEQLETQLEEFYGGHLATVTAEAEATRQRLDLGGIRGAWRFVSGKHGTDRKRLEALQLTIQDTEQRMGEQRGKLQREQAAERERLEARQAERKEQQQAGIERARERKEEALQARARDWWAEHTAAKQPEPVKDFAREAERQAQQEPEAEPPPDRQADAKSQEQQPAPPQEREM